MAESTDGRRGQLILVGGFALAVTFVALTLLLNASIYTHALATRPGSVADEGLVAQHGVEASVGGLVTGAIEDRPDDVAAQTSNVTTGIVALREQLGRSAARDSAHANVTYLSRTEGTHVVQSIDRNFSNANGAANWTLVDGATGLRRFQFDVTRGDLVDTSTAATLGDAFRVRLADTNGDEWLVYVSRHGDETRVLTEHVATGTQYGPCVDASGNRTVVDVTAGTVAGSRCPALEVFDRLPNALDVASGVAVHFERTADNGTVAAIGTYELVVDAAESTVDDGDFASEGSGSMPQAHAAVYAVDVRFSYRTTQLSYATDLTVAPGEPDD